MPGGTYCAVFGCNNNTRMKHSKFIFHSFPKGNVRDEWVARCGRRNKFNTRTSRICSAHFTPDDYERDLKHELLDLPSRRILKKSAVPILRLGNKETRKKNEASIARAKSYEAKQKRIEHKKIIDDLLANSTANTSLKETIKENPNPTETCQNVISPDEASDVSKNK